MSPLKVCQRHGCTNVFETSGARKFCSKSCKQKAYRDRHSTIPFDGWFIEKRCRNCGVKFHTQIKSREYCTDKCKQQHYRQRKKLERDIQK